MADADHDMALPTARATRASTEPASSLGHSAGIANATFAFGDEAWPGIAKLAEECGEVVQVIGKLMMTHGNPAHWSGNLRTMLIEEMADVEAAICFVRDHCLTRSEVTAMVVRVAEKRDKFVKWHADMDADPPPPLVAQGIETQSATTAGRGPQDESPVAESDAPNPGLETDNGR